MMSKILILLFIFTISLLAGSTPEKEATVQEKALFLNKKHYDKHLENTIKKENTKKKNEFKVYKRKDGTIDTLKTINAANQ